jgi:hypothetical protein
VSVRRTSFLAGIAASTALAHAGGIARAIPPPPSFHPILPLDFDGTTFRVSPSFVACETSWYETPHVAAADGTLALNGAVLLMPGCAPADSSAKLYVIAVQIDPQTQPGPRVYPRDFGQTFAAIPVAGPSNADEHPWIFAPIANALTMKAGKGYAFFVAEANLDEKAAHLMKRIEYGYR